MKKCDINQCRRFLFFVILILAMLPLGIFSINNMFYHQINNVPQTKGGVLDLEGYSLRGRKALPLDGEWEFYYNRWIVTEGYRPQAPDFIARVPRPWSTYSSLDMNGKSISSYRLVLKNCPEGEGILAYIPNIKARYRVYINGALVSSRGEVITDGTSVKNPSGAGTKVYPGVKIEDGGEAELIIELSGSPVGGLYKVPILTESDTNHVITDNRRLVTAVVVGILAVTIGCIAVLLIMGDRLLSSYALLVIDIVIFTRILFQNTHLPFADGLTSLQEYWVGILFLNVALFLPLVFLYCVNQLVHIKISNSMIRKIALYEICCVPLTLWSAMAGRPGMFFIMGIIGYLPFLFVIWTIYLGIRQGVAYSLEVSAVILLVISSMLVSTLDDTGWFITQVTLFQPVCLMLSMLIQLIIFFRRSVEAQNKAVEAENLRLKLKESESDLMLSQIKPHFLYNTLLVIHMLCTTDPETAAETVLKFASFLRANLNFSSSDQMIPFDKELAHIENYVDIEKLRHKERLTVRYEIGTTDFWVPLLCIQPLVENAIRHGACRNIKGGTVVLRTRETDRDFIVEVTDDGPGFEPQILKQPFEASHGLYNIEFRLRMRRNAKIVIDSKPEEGTCVTVTLPKEVTYEDNTD